jgi:hypothetical protein
MRSSSSTRPSAGTNPTSTSPRSAATAASSGRSWPRPPLPNLPQPLQGVLEDEQQIAVKKLSMGSRQGVREFLNKVRLLLKVQHRNLVSLLSSCASSGHKMLIYPYFPDGVGRPPPRRPRITRWGAARAMAEEPRGERRCGEEQRGHGEEKREE